VILVRIFLIALFLSLALPAGNRFTLPYGVFSYDSHPDRSLEDYAAGDLGIVLPTYARSYLYVAYRYLEGTPFTSEEQAALVDTWKVRLGQLRRAAPNSHAAWSDLRFSLDIPYPEPSDYAAARPPHRDTRDFIQWFPCTPDSSGRAVNRLLQLRERFGDESEAFHSWVRAQDLVYENCGAPAQAYLPPPAALSLPLPIRLDRQYQIAAAHFYAESFEAAEAAFRKIKPHPESPYSSWAPFMVGRTLLWRARTETKSDHEHQRLLHAAQRQFEAVLQDDDLAVSHPAARHLLIRILTVTDKEAAARLLGIRLMSELRGNTRSADLEHYLTLLDNVRGEPSWRLKTKLTFTQAVALGKRDRLTAWILAFQSAAPESFRYVIDQWRKTRSKAWLLAALAKVDPTDSTVSELLAAASEANAGPGQPTLDYYRARLLAAVSRREEARNVLDRLLPDVSNLPSTHNRALALRSQLSRNYNELMHYGERPLASFGRHDSWGVHKNPWRSWSQEDVSHPRVRGGHRLMPTTADILNSSLPLERFAPFAQTEDFASPSIQRDLAVAAWVRAVLLKRWSIATSLAPRVAQVAPVTAKSMRDFQAAAADQRGFLSKLILLRFPGFSPLVRPGLGRVAAPEEIHLNGDNWWWVGERLGGRPPGLDGGTVDWIEPSGRRQANEEWDRIEALGNSGAGWLFGAVRDACDQAGASSDCAEALYRAEYNRRASDYRRGLQYSGGDWDHFSAQHHLEILQRDYPQSRWARLIGSDLRDASALWRDSFGQRRFAVPYPR